MTLGEGYRTGRDKGTEQKVVLWLRKQPPQVFRFLLYGLLPSDESVCPIPTCSTP